MVNEAKIHGKYRVERTDGSSEPGGKHHECVYFVLDVTHDEHAIAALRAYARACRADNPELAADLRAIVAAADRPRCGCREACCPHSLLFAFDREPDEVLADQIARNK